METENRKGGRPSAGSETGELVAGDGQPWRETVAQGRRFYTWGEFYETGPESTVTLLRVRPRPAATRVGLVPSPAPEPVKVEPPRMLRPSELRRKGIKPKGATVAKKGRANLGEDPSAAARQLSLVDAPAREPVVIPEDFEP